MTIDRLGPINPTPNLNKSAKASKSSKKDRADSISFSEEAKSKGEIYKATEETRLVPDVRQDRITEVKKKLQDPGYIDEKVIETVAEKVLDLLQP